MSTRKVALILFILLISFLGVSCLFTNYFFDRYTRSKRLFNKKEEKLVKLIDDFKKDPNIYSLIYYKRYNHYFLNNKEDSVYYVYPFMKKYYFYDRVKIKHLHFDNEEELLKHAGVKKERILYWKKRFKKIGIKGFVPYSESTYFVYITPFWGLMYVEPEDKEIIEFYKNKGYRGPPLCREFKHIRDNWFYFLEED